MLNSKPNNFHGNVGLDVENKGIIITSPNKNIDKMLRLISEKIYSDIKQTLKSQPKFDTIEQVKTKITNFINK